MLDDDYAAKIIAETSTLTRLHKWRLYRQIYLNNIETFLSQNHELVIR